MSFISIIALTFIIIGCSSISIETPSNTKQIFPVPINYCIKSSATPNQIKNISLEDKEQFNNQIDSVMDDIYSAMNSNLRNIGTIELIEKSTCFNTDNVRKNEKLSDLGFELILDLSSYGSMKSKWKYYLIATGIGEGIAQGIVVAGMTHNTALAIGVAFEEFTSEYLTWNGVDWFLGETYAPVTLDGILIRNSDQTVVWEATEFVSGNDNEVDKLTKEEKEQKKNQLLASLHKAEDDLFLNLSTYLKNNFTMH